MLLSASQKISQDVLNNKRTDSSKQWNDENIQELKKFTVNSIKNMNVGKSLSPVPRRKLIHDDIDYAKLVRKYKSKKTEEQEKDIILNGLVNEIQQQKEKKFENHKEIAELLMKIVKIALE